MQMYFVRVIHTDKLRCLPVLRWLQRDMYFSISFFSLATQLLFSCDLAATFLLLSCDLAATFLRLSCYFLATQLRLATFLRLSCYFLATQLLLSCDFPATSCDLAATFLRLSYLATQLGHVRRQARLHCKQHGRRRVLLICEPGCEPCES